MNPLFGITTPADGEPRMKTTQAARIRSQPVKVTIAREGRLLTFQIGVSTFELGIAELVEIVRTQDMARTPAASDPQRGTIDLHGRTLAVMDFRTLPGIGVPRSNRVGSILVVRVPRRFEDVVIGIVVDQVTDLRESAGKDAPGIAEPPERMAGG